MGAYHTRSRRGLAAGTIIGGLLLAACGGNEPKDSSVTTPTSAVVVVATTVAPAVTDAPEATSPASSGVTPVTEPPAATDAPDTTGGPATTAAPVLTNPPVVTDPAIVPTAGGTLTVGIDGDSSGYSPQNDVWAHGGHDVARAIFDTLAVYDPDGKAVPYLAESIAANADSTVWTIVLRPGVIFHNGEPLDADAVRLNFDAVKNSAQFKDTLTLLASMRVVDDLTLELTMSAPWGSFMNVLTGGFSGQVGYIAAPAMLADPDGGRNPVGTGPFRFVEWVPDDHLTVVRNDDYWQQPAYLDEVVFRPIADSGSRKAAFDAGDIDTYFTASSVEINEYLGRQEDGEVHVTVAPPADPDVLLFNTRIAPLDDIRVRKALVMALDFDRLFDFLEGTGVKQKMHGPYADTSFWYVDTDYPDFDPEGARALVDEYEAQVGPIEFEYAGNQDPFVVSYQELIQSMWADVGIDASIESKAQGENIAAVFNGEFQVTGWGGLGGDDPDNDYTYFHSGGLNLTGYTSAAIDAAMDAGRALSDPDARKEQYAIVQRDLAEHMPYAWMGTNQFAVVSQEQVIGLDAFTLPDGEPGRPLTGGRFYLKDVWIQQ